MANHASWPSSPSSCSSASLIAEASDQAPSKEELGSGAGGVEAAPEATGVATLEDRSDYWVPTEDEDSSDEASIVAAAAVAAAASASLGIQQRSSIEELLNW